MNQDERIRQLQLQVFNFKDMVQRLVVENRELRDVVIQYADTQYWIDSDLIWSNGPELAQDVLNRLYDPQKLQQLLKLQRDATISDTTVNSQYVNDNGD
jgi:hypothetical protein